jgi:uncharacterized protein (UPF0276 family)
MDIAREAKAPPVAGLEWCTSLAAEIERRLDEIPLLEIIPENFLDELGNAIPRQFFRELERRGVPVMVHSIALSIASIEPLKRDYLERILDVARAIPTCVGLSDHLCMTEKDGSEVGQLTTAPYDEPTLDWVARKIDAIQRATGAPFVVENIAHPFMVPGQAMRETEFIRRLQARTGCKLLLDLHNIYTNGINFGLDPYAYLDEIALDDVDSIHLAGGYYDEHGMLQDGHCARVPAEVWKLYAHVVRAAGRPLPTIVERTSMNQEHGLEPVLEDQRKAQAIMDVVLRDEQGDGASGPRATTAAPREVRA